MSGRRPCGSASRSSALSVSSHRSRCGRNRLQVFEDRAIGALIAVTRTCEVLQHIGHRGHFGDALPEVGEMGEGKTLHQFRGTPPIAPQRQQLADFVERKSKVTPAPDKLQDRDIAIVIVAVAVVPPRRLGQEPNTLIIADHLGAYVGAVRGGADIH